MPEYLWENDLFNYKTFLTYDRPPRQAIQDF